MSLINEIIIIISYYLSQEDILSLIESNIINESCRDELRWEIRKRELLELNFYYKVELSLEDILFLNRNLNRDKLLRLFYFACRNNRLDIIKCIFDKIRIDSIILENHWALRLSARYGHPEIVKFLFKNGSGKDGVISENHWALRWAAGNGHLEVVKFLFENGSGRDGVISENHEALRNASCGGHLEVVKFLFENGSGRKGVISANYEALRKASRYGYLEVVKFLFENGSGKEGIVSNNHEALRNAQSNNHIEIVRFLTSKLK